MAGPDENAQPRVFLSYTLDPQSDELRERLVRALGEAGFEAWMGVPPGEEPERARDRYLDGAQAAVAILSAQARESEWMRAEGDLLRRRAERDPGFVLAVLATPDAGAEALARWDSYAVDREAGADGQVAQVLERLAPLRPDVDAAAAGGRRGFTTLRAGDHAGGVGAVALVSLDGNPCVATGDGAGTLRVIDIGRDELRLELRNVHSGFVSAIAGGTLGGAPIVVSGGYDGILHVVDLVDAKVIASQSVHQGPIGGLALLDTQPGPLAVAGGHDGTVQAWNLTRGALTERAQTAGHAGPVRSVTVAMLGGRPIAISGGDDRRLRLWDLTAMTPVGEARRGHTGAVLALAAAELRGRPVAVSGGADGTLRLWDLAADQGELGAPLQAHAESVLAICTATFGGRTVAVSAGMDGAVRAWDLRSAAAIGDPLLGHDGAVGAVAAGLVGSAPAVVSGGSDGTARVWEVPELAAPAGDAPPGADTDDRVEWVSDARAEVDLLQRRPLADALATRLRRLREDEPGRSFLIHVDGRWGSGKSTLLELLRKELADDWLVVEFDAWRQMRVGPPWWALLASLRHAVRRDMGRLAALRLRVAEAEQRVRRGGALYVVAVAAVLAAAVGVALLLGAGLDIGAADRAVSSILAGSAAIGALYAAMSAVGRFLLWDSAAGARVFEQSHRDPMDSVADHFAWLIGRAGRPVAFFVDDLDRCANEYVVELLDSVQTLIRDAPARLAGRPDRDRACYVVVAADGRWIRTSYEHAHGEFAEAVDEPGRPLGYLFLDKIFQLTVPVPSISPQRQAAYLQALLRVEHDGAREQRIDVQVRDVSERVAHSTSEAEALEAFDEAPPEVRAAVAGAVVGKLAQPQIEAATQHRLERFAGLLETNPRAMKLVLNAYGIARALQVIEDNVVPGDALALWTILRVRWPALADYLTAHPAAIEALADGREPEGAPPALARLFRAPEVRRIVDCEDGGPLSAAIIRACCGIAEDAALSPPPRAGTP